MIFFLLLFIQFFSLYTSNNKSLEELKKLPQKTQSLIMQKIDKDQEKLIQEISKMSVPLENHLISCIDKQSYYLQFFLSKILISKIFNNKTILCISEKETYKIVKTEVDKISEAQEKIYKFASNIILEKTKSVFKIINNSKYKIMFKIKSPHLNKNFDEICLNFRKNNFSKNKDKASFIYSLIRYDTYYNENTKNRYSKEFLKNINRGWILFLYEAEKLKKEEILEIVNTIVNNEDKGMMYHIEETMANFNYAIYNKIKNNQQIKNIIYNEENNEICFAMFNNENSKSIIIIKLKNIENILSNLSKSIDNKNIYDYYKLFAGITVKQYHYGNNCLYFWIIPTTKKQYININFFDFMIFLEICLLKIKKNPNHTSNKYWIDRLRLLYDSTEDIGKDIGETFYRKKNNSSEITEAYLLNKLNLLGWKNLEQFLFVELSCKISQTI